MRQITYKTCKSAKPNTGREQLVRKTLSSGSRPIACLGLLYEFTEHHNLYIDTKTATTKKKCKPY
jgi:hypothetical protein